jgi:hypothetical protein
MSCHKLIDHISALGRVGEQRADELYQLLCLEVDESTFIKEVADICQRGLLERKYIQTYSNLSSETTYQELGKIREFEPRRDAPNNKRRLQSHGYNWKGSQQIRTYLFRSIHEQPFKSM